VVAVLLVVVGPAGPTTMLMMHGLADFKFKLVLYWVYSCVNYYHCVSCSLLFLASN